VFWAPLANWETQAENQRRRKNGAKERIWKLPTLGGYHSRKRKAKQKREVTKEDSRQMKKRNPDHQGGTLSGLNGGRDKGEKTPGEFTILKGKKKSGRTFPFGHRRNKKKSQKDTKKKGRK